MKEKSKTLKEIERILTLECLIIVNQNFIFAIMIEKLFRTINSQTLKIYLKGRAYEQTQDSYYAADNYSDYDAWLGSREI